MVSIKSINKIFTYPKFRGLVNSIVNDVEVPLEHETLLWLEEVLAEYFNDGIKKISNHRSRPWSRVFKIETNRERLYFLKIPAKEFYHEAQIVEFIQSLCSDITVTIIARNKTNGSFLMVALDGETLRAKIRKQFEQSTLEYSVARIGEFQKYIREYISEFEKFDVPKWTSKTIIENCELLIQNSRFLFHTGLSSKEIFEFKSLFPAIHEKLIILTRLDNGYSIDHGDFQDNNIFVSKDRILFMDWADASISIPSFTIGTYCHSILLAHPSITNNPILIQNILTKYYFSLLGTEYNELNEWHIPLVHFLYPMTCILKVGRLLNLEDKKSDKYSSTIVDYWIRVVISFCGAYRDKTLGNEII